MVKFQWPLGELSELKIYPTDHPERKPTEEYFACVIRRDIRDVRRYGNFTNLPVLIMILTGRKAEFHSWLKCVETVLGNETCRAIGKRVCREEDFTLEEGKKFS